MRCLTRGLTTALALLASTTAALAAVDLHVQAPTTASGYLSAIHDLPGDPGFTWSLPNDQQAWAYLRAAASGSVERITWYGSDADGSFAVDFFQAACLSCGVNLVKTDGIFTSNLLPDAGPHAPGQVQKLQVLPGVYAYSIDLSAGVPIQAGQLYALSVVNNHRALPFQWAPSDVGLNGHVRYISGVHMVQQVPGNLALALSGTAAPVPEPAPRLLLALGAMLLWGLQSRRARAHSHPT